MNEEEILNTPVGDKEIEPLEPKIVKILSVQIKEVKVKGDKKSQILDCVVKHEDMEESFAISQIKFEDPKTHKMEVSGLWISTDEDKKLRKGSALARFLTFMKVETPKELEGKECVLDTWASMGKWMHELNEGRDILPEGTIQALKQMTDTCKSKLEKVEAIFKLGDGLL